MLFVGVIGENKDYRLLNKRIKKEISKFKEKLELIDIDDKSIDNLKNVKFDTIVILSFPNKLNNKVYEIRKTLENCKYLIINTDIDINKTLIEELQFDILTFGLNQKSTITASSIGDNNMIICLQRNIKNAYQELIEPNEFNIKFNENIDNNAYNCLAYFSILLLYNATQD